MLKIGAVILLVFDLTVLISSSNEFPQFVNIPKTVTVRESYLVLITKFTDWYAAWPTDLRVTLMGHKKLLVNFHCTVNTLSEENKLTEMKFCFVRKGSSSEICETLTAGKLEGNKNNFLSSRLITVKMNMNLFTGGVATLNAPDSEDASSSFYCIVKNKRGTIQSNKVTLMDYRSQFPQSLTTSGQINKVYMDGPTMFDCKSISVPPNVELKYVWYMCPNDNLDTCVPPTWLMAVETWPMQIFKNGTLYFPFVTEEKKALLQGRYIYCGINNVPTKFYRSPLTFVTGSPNPVKGLQITSPKVGMKYKLLNSKGTRKTVVCNFLVGLGKTKIIWKKMKPDGSSVQLSVGNQAQYKVIVRDGSYSIGFQGPFDAETEGEYMCEIEWIPAGGSGKVKKSRKFSVELEYFPRIKDLVPKMYVVSGNNGSFACKFERNSVKPSLAINGQKIDISSKKALDSSVNEINGAQSSHMAALKVLVSPLNPKPGDSIIYTALDMVNKSMMNDKSSTHQVDCIGENDAGKARGTVLLQVIPKLVMLAIPSSTNCSSCSAKEAHEFKCVIKNIQDYNVTTRKVIVSQSWKLGSTVVNVGKSHAFLAVSDDNSTLIIKKIDNAESKDFINKHGKITCVIKLSYPSTMAMPKPQFYSTEEDPDMNSKLSTSIQLMDIAPKPKAASLNWAIVLGLAILVVLIIVVLVFAMCRHHRKPGETYDVDHTEKKQGNDPEAENHEKEAFPVYERPEDGPIRGSRASLDDSIHVGSDDEDEDLAEYDVDIGKFNEEGSFIGQYAVNDSHHGEQPNNSRKLPHVSSNTDV